MGNRTREYWNRLTAEYILKQRPEFSGKLDWDTISWLWHSDLSSQEAAIEYLKTYHRKEHK